MSDLDKDIFYTGAFNHTIVLKPEQLKISNSIDDIIFQFLKESIENRCIKHGFIKKDSVNIIKRSIGKLNSSRLDGSISFDVFYSASICNPSKGQLINCKVKNINKMGILAENHPITCVIPRTNIGNKEYDNIELDSNIKVKIIGIRYDLYDKQVTAIGDICN